MHVRGRLQAGSLQASKVKSIEQSQSIVQSEVQCLVCNLCTLLQSLLLQSWLLQSWLLQSLHSLLYAGQRKWNEWLLGQGLMRQVARLIVRSLARLAHERNCDNPLFF